MMLKIPNKTFFWFTQYYIFLMIIDLWNITLSLWYYYIIGISQHLCNMPELVIKSWSWLLSLWGGQWVWELVIKSGSWFSRLVSRLNQFPDLKSNSQTQQPTPRLNNQLSDSTTVGASETLPAPTYHILLRWLWWEEDTQNFATKQCAEQTITLQLIESSIKLIMIKW